jgi:hypothetical protein
MLIENITFSKDELNSGSGIIKSITDIVLPINSFNNKNYRPAAIKCSNKSGAAINFALFTDFEYEEWVSDPTISHVLAVENNAAESINPLGEITKIICSGSVSNTSGVVFAVIKE